MFPSRSRAVIEVRSPHTLRQTRWRWLWRSTSSSRMWGRWCSLTAPPWCLTPAASSGRRSPRLTLARVNLNFKHRMYAQLLRDLFFFCIIYLICVTFFDLLKLGHVEIMLNPSDSSILTFPRNWLQYCTIFQLNRVKFQIVCRTWYIPVY